ncbi:MAG: response regulator [Patescibacteria group bacterium]|jgi:CheY-like chemotaxis protein
MSTAQLKVVLIVEDELPLQTAIKKKLETSGFSTITARTVDQALDYLKSLDKVDVIWLDHYLLGSKTGLDFVTEVKNSPVWKTIPIFVVSNTASADKVTSYLQLGVEKYYTKSDYRLDEIIAVVIESLKKQE